MEAREAIRRCLELAEYTEEPGRITRRFLTPPMRGVHRRVRAWMEEAGLETRVDAAGNLCGRRGGGPRLMIGSHLDTVPHAGAYDGILGVVLGIALAGRCRNCALEIAAFSEEEGARFGVPFIGSRAVAGDPVMEEDVLAAIRDFGLDPACLPRAEIDGGVGGYFEIHIEQGPVLEAHGIPLGVVDAIVGQRRLEVTFRGKANHAGATPMDLRRDALAGAAEWIGLVEREARGVPGLVATVGWLEVAPGASNVIPGTVRATLDARHAHEEILNSAQAEVVGAAERIAGARGLSVEAVVRSEQPATAMDADLVATLERSVAAAGYPVHRITSGAGHDAMILARRVPAVMLFLRSPGGISHHPDEAVLEEDVAAALAAGERFVMEWGKRYA
ncbi:MAG: Zn-dependent hydrolase [Bryobacteraceae bacterium]